MKTAISLEGDLLSQADRTARQMGVSRSRLFSLALEAYLRSRQQEAMIEQLNRVYTADADPAEARTTKAMKAKFRSGVRERW